MTRFRCANCNQYHTIRLPQAAPLTEVGVDWLALAGDLFFGTLALTGLVAGLLMLVTR